MRIYILPPFISLQILTEGWLLWFSLSCRRQLLISTVLVVTLIVVTQYVVYSDPPLLKLSLGALSTFQGISGPFYVDRGEMVVLVFLHYVILHYRKSLKG